VDKKKEKFEEIECLIRELLLSKRVKRIVIIIDYGSEKGEESG